MNSDQIRRTFADHLTEQRWVQPDDLKVPQTPGTNQPAKINDTETLGVFRRCRGRSGIVLGDNGLGKEVWGLDFDACRNPETGEFTE